MKLSDENLARELQKILDVVMKVDEHLSFKDNMNAALHMSDTVRPTPLASAVNSAAQILYDLIAEAQGHDQPRYAEKEYME